MTMVQNLLNIILKTSAIGASILGIMLLGLYFFQNKMIYLPDHPFRLPEHNPYGYRTPSEAGLEYEDINITASDGITLHGWFVKCKNHTKVPTIIYFHENAGNIGTRIPFMKFYSNTNNINIILVAYRGYSYSKGIPTEEGLKLDSLAVINHAFSRNDIDKTKIFIHGRSLGGAVSLHGLNSTNHPIAGLILENTFTSLGDMVDRIFPKLSIFKKLILRNYWRSIELIDKIKCPIFFILSMKDELVPTEHMLELYSKAKNARFINRHEIPEGSHNENWSLDPDTYFRAINRFIEISLKQ